MPETYRIGELARELSVPVETIRYYEKAGLLARPARSYGNYRLYNESQRQQLAFVLHCRALDMTQAEIRQLLDLQSRPEQGCEEVNHVLDAHIDHVLVRIRTLHALEAELRKIRASCHAGGTTKDCAILQELSGTRARASRIESAATPRDRQRRSVASTRDGLGRSRCQR
ncbi:MAG: Cd(II)/Pb(II)-responsive transcriptional regulator [Sinimarinibacterium flocculans]|jgi:Cd(II)/Pb(II)-responsive transcriptional regulator|uniref:Cd(II)/Pb(II)-responsive transcriptional regulator n=1 Tax=Sinimarinibacterium flocculans TaxID=985250 RepID=A0A318E576_9GAMM|nr:Cd(II)/Pb(II)-responsive transcriptional regulator [Sinimarinibacterium flocculans]PXV63741.1 Cd(II)/Pb(II)-responsive transcriptional regulator [Sinimarinibacterium flocculans]HBG31873.1 Cd(II)/Pb(II)-responsive transcriptional regulator [Gammaproteobacteria bacterium]